MTYEYRQFEYKTTFVDEMYAYNYLEPFREEDSTRMRAWRETRAYQTGAWVMMWVGVAVVGLCYLLL